MKLTLMFLWLALAIPASAEDLTLEVSAGDHDRRDSMVTFDLPAALADAKSFSLQTGDDQLVAVQRDEQGKQPRLVWLLEAPLAAEEKRTYRLLTIPAKDPVRQDLVVVEKNDSAIAVKVAGLRVLNYNHAVVPSDDPAEPAYRRSGFIHPVWDPRGNVVTDGMPPDHMHQHGLMFAWVDTKFQGRNVDFWNSGKKQGEVRHRGIESMQSGPVFGRFRVTLEHVDLTAEKPVVALRETWQVTVYRRSDAFLFDLESEQSCATNDPLVINKYHYGGMAFRGARDWSGEDRRRFLTSAGHDRKTGNHTSAWWCDISGPVADGVSGVTVFCGDENFRAPQAMRLHPTMPYFVWSPMVQEGFTIEPGKPYRSRYRYLVHAGEVDAKLADAVSLDDRTPLVAVMK